MGHRLSKITTRTGDAGETGLGDGSRRGKDSLRVDAMGEVDELNSSLGVLLAEPLPEPARELLLAIQHDLFDLGGELAVPGHTMVTDAQVQHLEAAVEALNANLRPLKEFILPGGSRPAALAHQSRTLCRRAERAVVALGREEEVAAPVRVYLNRLSDLLFVLARDLNRPEHGGQGDVLWNRNRGG